MVRGRDRFGKYKPVINFLVSICSIFPYKMRLSLFQHHRMVQGTKGLVLRYVLLKTIAKNCGDNISIHPNVFILNPQNLSIGSNVSVHPMCYIEAFGGIDIGDDVSIAHGATIISTGHNFDKLGVTINNQSGYCAKVTINNDVWIGAKVTILAGNTINSGSIIGANAVVTKDVQSNTVVGGIPAKILKVRK